MDYETIFKEKKKSRSNTADSVLNCYRVYTVGSGFLQPSENPSVIQAQRRAVVFSIQGESLL